jgi:hypothetical protein
VTLKLGKLYKLGNSVYDPWDEVIYTIKIVQEPMIYSHNEYYYKAQIIKMGDDLLNQSYFMHLYPDDWEIIEELSSLEVELL